MTFLAPAAGAIAAALAVPVLLLFYFLKLRRKQVRVSSTLLWQHAMQDLQVNTPFRWLRVSVLLILQLLALLLLIGAVARPALTSDGPTGSRIIIVLDRSASMSAGDGVPGAAGERATRLDEAQRRALELVTRLGRRSGGFGFGGSAGDWEACVVSFAARAETLTPFTSDIGALREAVESVRPTDQPGDFAALLRLVDALSGATGDEAAPGQRTTVYLMSDGSFAVNGTLPQPRGVDIELVRAGPLPPASDIPASHNNLGIVSLSARRDYDAPATVRIFARVLSASAGPIERMVQLRVDGEAVDARTLDVPGARTDAQGIGAPGEAAVTFELQNTDGGVAVVSLAGSDLLAADDAAAMVLTPSGRARVLVVAPGENGSDADDYLMSVLEAMELRALRTAPGDAYEEMIVRAQNPNTVPLGGVSSIPDIRDWDLIIFDRIRPSSLPPLPTLSFGAAVPMPGMSVGDALDPAQSAAAEPERVVSWQRTHPVLKYASLDQVLISPPRVLTLPADVAGGKAEAVAWGEHGPLIGVVEGGAGGPAGVGLRRIVVAFEIARSTWGPDFSFPVFLSNAVEYLTMRGDASAGRSARTVDPIQIQAEPRATEVRVSGPATLAVPVRAGPDDSRTVSLGQLERVGVYEINAGGLAAQPLAVNLLDQTETLVRTSNGLSLGSLSRALDREGREAVQEIWHWFLAAAFLLLVAEWFIAAWKMRM